MNQFKVKLFDNNPEYMPERANQSDAGFDLKARAVCNVIDGVLQPEIVLQDNVCYLEPWTRILVKTGVFLELMEGWEAQIRPRSGNALKYGITVTNSPGTIDAGYRNEIGVILQNTTSKDYAIKRLHKVAQMVIKQVPTVELVQTEEDLNNTDRGQGGFGSTGQ